MISLLLVRGVYLVNDLQLTKHLCRLIYSRLAAITDYCLGPLRMVMQFIVAAGTSLI